MKREQAMEEPRENLSQSHQGHQPLFPDGL